MTENVKEYDDDDICNDNINEDDYKSTLNLNTFITLHQLMSIDWRCMKRRNEKQFNKYLLHSFFCIITVVKMKRLHYFVLLDS